MWLMIVWVGSPLPVGAQWLTQEIQLQPGWNAIHVPVQPEPADLDTLFGGTPVESVWQWNRRFSAAQFVTDPQSLLPENPDWLMWFPPSNPRSFLKRLATLKGNHAYLIKVSDQAQPFMVPVKGRVLLYRPQWFPHGLNLVGLPVHPAHPPSFTEFFRFTPEVNTSADFANELYRIDSQARGVRIVQPAREFPQPGIAYWVACAKPPAHLSRLHLETAMDTVDFGEQRVERDLRLQNVHATDPLTVTLVQRESETPPVADGVAELAGSIPLSYLARSTTNTWEWTRFPAAGLSLTLAPGESRALRLGLRRAELTGLASRRTNDAAYQGILEVTDFAQSLLHRVPLVARTPRLGSGLGATPDPHCDFEGLWVGTLRLDQVNAPAYTNGLLPTPSPFSLRLLLHVDGAGLTHLLQQVLLAWDPTRNAPPHTNGSYALFAGEENVPANATQVSRISSAAWPTMAPTPLSGVFGSSLTGVVTIASGNPSNPFLHRYHPLHDNRDGNGNPYTSAVEVPAISRDFSLTFDAVTNANADLLAGVSVMSGVYAETLSGLRAQPVRVEGNFALRRISPVNQLQGVSP